MAGNTLTTTTVSDLPDVILSNILSAVSDTRSRNSAALVSRKWLLLERSTRSSLTLRANLRDLLFLPTCFRHVTHLDLSLLSPWGHPLSTADPSYATTSHLLPHLLRRSFPSVTSLTVYSRSPLTLQLLSPIWPHLTQIKLIRWHQRPQLLPQGADFAPLFENCRTISSLDLSSFYCWNDDVPIALQSNPNLAANLTWLNLLNPSFAEGFKSDEIKLITSSCPNLSQFLVACKFDHRYIGFVNDETLGFFASDCPKLSVLHLVDTSALSNPREELNDESLTAEDARFGAASLIDMFSGLPLLEELVLDVCRNVRECRVALEELNSKCPRLKSLKLGQFHGLCRANEPNLDSRLDGIALCHGLEALSIKNSVDLTDLGLIAIARGCSRLVKFEVHGCRKITVRGMRTMVCLLRKSLVEVNISCCKNLGAVSSLKALDPIQDRIQRLHIDCVWDSVEQFEAREGVEYNFDLNKSEEEDGEMMMMINQQSLGFGLRDFFDGRGNDDEGVRKQKKCKYSYDLNSSLTEGDASDNGNGFCGRAWEKLRFLSLWIGVGELLSPLANSGLQNCPNLEEMRIKVEGDCREWSKPSERAFGLGHLSRYPKLKKMHLDCGDTIGFAHTAPSGQMDLSLWERFYLFGIQNLSLNELDYWPPQDRDVNQRSLSLPAAGLLAECSTLRKLFIHGTAHEHFMMFLLRIPNLRDVQLREDYYPAPENDMSTEMRADSCSRFEDALNRRTIPD
ncbi:F-box/LRR-repeat MAX2 homolog A [Rhododendron vialii]|uniref:F-box/LRR-repeat MAX2 homolog A n=1 Tax=Rhododendron vialii TaxID=182163 RepID=UPI00265FD8FA|nr:F-box/LRR-repeat MAX2 homolog A [Rhododendron vialii]